MIPDPTNDGASAIDEKGRVVYAIRGLPWSADRPPTAAELEAAPILGYPILCDGCDEILCRCPRSPR